MGRGASAQLHQVNVQGDEKVMYLYIYIYGTPFAHEKGRLSRGGVPYRYFLHEKLILAHLNVHNSKRKDEQQGRKSLRMRVFSYIVFGFLSMVVSGSPKRL